MAAKGRGQLTQQRSPIAAEPNRVPDTPLAREIFPPSKGVYRKCARAVDRTELVVANTCSQEWSRSHGRGFRSDAGRGGVFHAAGGGVHGPAYPGYNPGAGEGLRPFEPRKTRAPVELAGGGVAPLPSVAAHPDG